MTSTELGYLSGVTSNIQDQLNGKVSNTGDTITGNLSVSGATSLHNLSSYLINGFRLVSFKSNDGSLKLTENIPGRSSIIVSAMINGVGSCLYSIGCTSENTIYNITKISGEEYANIGACANGDGTITIELGGQWSYGFAIFSGAWWV